MHGMHASNPSSGEVRQTDPWGSAYLTSWQDSRQFVSKHKVGGRRDGLAIKDKALPEDLRSDPSSYCWQLTTADGVLMPSSGLHWYMH